MRDNRLPYQNRLQIEAWAMDRPEIATDLERTLDAIRESTLHAHRVWQGMLAEGKTPEFNLEFQQRCDPRAE